MPGKPQPIEPRFWLNVRKTKGCWEWTACKMTRGYGQISLNGKCIGAHVVSFLLSGRSIPKGYVIMHKCDNKGCVNPKHLVAAPHKINMADLRKKRLAAAVKSEAGTSRNTVKAYLGYSREEWQKLTQAKRERILARKK